MRTSVSLKDLRRERQELLGRLRAAVSKASNRRSRLQRFLESLHVDFSRDLESFPEFHSRHYEKKYGEFKRSFELLDIQIQSLLEKVAAQAVTMPVVASRPASESIDEWLDHLDDLEETFEDYERRLERQYHADLMGLVKALDTVKRVTTLDIPDATSQGKVYYRGLEQLKQITRNLGKRLENSLRGRRVKVIDLRTGEYPPLETTRIVSREDGGTGDDVVVTQVVEKGYLWKGKVLRKAAVIIATRREEN